MVRNHNRYWMSPKFFMSASAEGGADTGTAGDAAPGGAAGTEGTEGTENGAEAGVNPPSSESAKENSADALNAEIARLKAELAKQKTSLDKATSEAGNLRKELRSKMTQDQIDAAEKKEAEEAQAKLIADLQKQVAKTETVKSVMGTLGLDEETSGNLADCLYGAADIKNALLTFQKAWQAREKQLKLEYGKITAPGAGTDSNSPEAQAIRRAAEIGKAKNAVNEQAQKAINAYIR